MKYYYVRVCKESVYTVKVQARESGHAEEKAVRGLGLKVEQEDAFFEIDWTQTEEEYEENM